MTNISKPVPPKRKYPGFPKMLPCLGLEYICGNKKRKSKEPGDRLCEPCKAAIERLHDADARYCGDGNRETRRARGG